MNNSIIDKKTIESYLTENSLSITGFCKICGISPSTYKKVMSDKNYEINALFKIAKVLNVEIHQMFNKEFK